MATRNTPVLGMSGVWDLVSPWSAPATNIYTCTALRSFTELVGSGIDIYNTYYAPNGLTEDNYNTDLAAGAVLCILYSDTAGAITVPDTYINSYPGMGMGNYGQVIISASLGPMSLSINLDFLKEQVGNVISDTIGITPTIYVDQLGTTTAISQEDADKIEAARLTAITNRTTTYAQNLTLTQQVKTLTNQITILQTLLAKKEEGS